MVLRSLFFGPCSPVDEGFIWFETSTKAWYDHLMTYLLDRGFKRGYAD